jgi:hypothetical protein
MDVGRQVKITQVEPGRVLVPAEHRQGMERIPLDAPPLLGMAEAG